MRTVLTRYAAVNAKKLVHEYSTGTMASVFSNDSPNAGKPLSLSLWLRLVFIDISVVGGLTVRPAFCNDGGKLLTFVS